MDRDVLKDILLSQERQFDRDIVARTLKRKIDNLKTTPFIIIISGVRRCGKSTLLRLLKTNDAYYVNFDDERFIDFEVRDFQGMYELLIALFGERGIFLFDEIQNISGWERFVRRLHNDGKKVYVTGSNASMLSNEFGTHLTGRHISLSLFPFSFGEFLSLKGKGVRSTGRVTSNEKSLIKGLFAEYLLQGGFPEFLATQKEEYLKAIYESILYRDIITRHRLTGEKALKETVYYAASNLGKEISFNAIKNATGLTSATSVKDYFEYLEDSFMVFLVSRYDFSLKKQIYYNKKVYFVDPALARVIGFRVSEDAGRMLENVVFLFLKQRYSNVYFHKETFECDFLIREGARITKAIQVTYSLKKNRQREIEGLAEAMARYKLKEGTILTNDAEEELKIGKHKIHVQPAWKWLIENE
jgi:predicted AAA+ superfamily ATPase